MWLDKKGINGLRRSYYQLRDQRKPFEPLADWIKCDTCIVGAGYTGLSTALHLAAAGQKVVVLEARTAGSGASGRNGGQILPGFARDMGRIRTHLGATHARALWQLSIEAIEFIKSFAATSSLNMDLQAGQVTAALSMEDLNGAIEGYQDLKTHYGYDTWRRIDAAELKTMLASTAFIGGVLDTGGGHLDPGTLLSALRNRASEHGVNIYENTIARSITEDNKKRKVQTDTGGVSCRSVVIAAGPWTGRLVPKIAGRILPAYTFMIATKPLDAIELIPSNVAVTDTQKVLDYFRVSRDKRLLYGGGISFFRLPAGIIRKCLRRKMLGVFPQLTNVDIEYAWEGMLDITANRLPHVGLISDGIYYAYGYSGHGVALAVLVGRTIANDIIGDKEQFEILSAIPQKKYFRFPLHNLASIYEIIKFNIE